MCGVPCGERGRRSSRGVRHPLGRKGTVVSRVRVPKFSACPKSSSFEIVMGSDATTCGALGATLKYHVEGCERCSSQGTGNPLTRKGTSVSRVRVSEFPTFPESALGSGPTMCGASSATLEYIVEGTRKMMLPGRWKLANQEGGGRFFGVEFPGFSRFRKVPVLQLLRGPGRPCAGRQGPHWSFRGTEDAVSGALGFR